MADTRHAGAHTAVTSVLLSDTVNSNTNSLNMKDNLLCRRLKIPIWRDEIRSSDLMDGILIRTSELLVYVK